MPTIRDTVTVDADVEIDFDLSDYESEIESEYCNGNCLKDGYNTVKDKLTDYISEMEKNLYIYADRHKQFKSYEEIYRDLKYIVENN